MDKRAAGQYLNRLFGKDQGFVAVAYKDKGESWQECTFEFPAERTKLLAWAEIHQDANVFICPALRKGNNRIKGDMVSTKWLWADVDWDKVPEEKRDDVRARIIEVGTIVVASGSGENAHVYVQVDRFLNAEEHYRLNSGLRDYLYADAKHADNSLLRLPGTTNWKTDAGSPVRMRHGGGKTTTVDKLMDKRAFARVKVTASVGVVEGNWKLVDVSDFPRRIKAMASMDTAQAVARYGSRHKAVWAVTGDLHKRGLDDDQIHSLMDQFPPAIEKNAEEHDGYDVHRDVDKRLLWDRSQMRADDEMEEIDSAAGDVFEEMSVEEVRDALITEGVEKELLRRDIHRAADMAEAVQGHTRPPDDASESLSDALEAPPAPVQWLIDGMCSANATVVITGQFKTGKTKMMVASLISSLADGTPFLGVQEVFVPEGGAIIGHWNLEMSRLDFVDKYARPVGFKNPDNVKLAHWRGYRVNILTEMGKADAVAWLKERNVQVWTIDSWTALCRMCGVDGNDGKDVSRILGAIEEIKVEASVDVCFFLAHTAKGGDPDKPATRGASEVDEHVDTRWMLTVDKSDIRFIQVQGRDTQMNATSLDFNEETGRSTLGSARQSAAADGWVQEITRIVLGFGDAGITQDSLWKKMKEVRSIGRQAAVDLMVEADENGFIRREKGISTGRGGRAPWMHYPPVSAQGTNPRMKATARDVDLRHVGNSRKRTIG